ncbi:hypothetical protein J4470_03040 [Candidatus Woesearchaeota archaeon]|nr:hypothetical protein [Candidatus Woesearchaeota archaeon]
MKRITSRGIAVVSLGIVVGGLAVSLGFASVYAAKRLSIEGSQQHKAAVEELESLDSEIGRYWASLNIGNPLESSSRAVEYCANPFPVKQQADADYLCGTLVPRFKTVQSEEADARALIERAKKEARQYLVNAVYIGSAVVLLSMIGRVATGRLKKENAEERNGLETA